MKKETIETIKEILLHLVATGGILITTTSPYFLLNIAKGIIKDKKYLKNKLEERKIAKILDRLRRNKVIILKEEGEKFKVELTEKGKRKVKEIKFKEMKIEKPKIWDGKWRIVIFDIPDKYKKTARDALREKLKELNFYLLQKSVWVIPYPCQKEIQFLCELFNITPFVNIIVAENIYNDFKLRKKFKLL